MTTLQSVHCHVEVENAYCGDWPSGHDGGVATHVGALPAAATATWPAEQLASPHDTIIADGGASFGEEGVAEPELGVAPERASAPETTLLLVPHRAEKRLA
jgi:hypothetical protein